MITDQYKQLAKLWEYGLGRTILAVFCVHSVSISIGICQGYSAILLPQLHRSTEYHLDAEEMSWIASLGVVTNPFGSILSGLLADKLGRKLSIQLSTIPFVLGWLCIAFATNIYHLYAGRLVTGIAAGMSAACYTYVSEVSEPQHRGLFQALGPVSASFGILFIYVAGSLFHWQVIVIVPLIFAICTGISVHFVPESPAYLIAKGTKGQGNDNSVGTKFNTETFTALVWFRRSNAQAQVEYENLWAQTHLEVSKNKNFIRNYFKASTLKPFGILVVLFFLQEMSGIYTILFYAVNFFQEADLSLDENIISILVGLVRFLMSIVAAFLINRFTRRSLCMVSSGGMALSLGAILLSNLFILYIPQESLQIVNTEENNKYQAIQIFQLICIHLNILFSMTGMLPIPWILVGEMFPMSVRCIMSGVVICIAQCFIFLSVKIYPMMIAQLSFQGNIGVFAISSLLALVFIKLYLPETKNKTLEEIEQYFTEPFLGTENPEMFMARRPSVFETLSKATFRKQKTMMDLSLPRGSLFIGKEEKRRDSDSVIDVKTSMKQDLGIINHGFISSN